VTDEARGVWMYQSFLSGKLCEPIVDFDREFTKLVDQLWRSMDFYKGVGLAAPQVGIFFQVAVIQVRDTDPLVITNPKWKPLTAGVTAESEGCLSMPGRGFRALVKRYNRVQLDYYDVDGCKRELEATGMLARAIQHECDHLVGKFFFDHLPSLQRKMLIQKLRKNLKEWRRREKRPSATMLGKR